ncbi:sensor histidine kinase [Arthrobacter sp. UM1]|uniref:sensor histidine kinase n=1 Tax=Arthrobacter sp. UM1 TaxID=2766776 RepID=UPI001CF63E07|nr:histidine kinase [Arthrobacter sp. UM1]MCB4208861.1 hypothetical protein [Arthrobacter sp. UM1]
MGRTSSRSGILFGAVYLAVVLVSASGPGNKLWSWSPDGFFPVVLVSLPGIAGAVLRHRWPRAAYALTVASAVGSFAVGAVVPLMLFLFDACYLAAVRWGLAHRSLVLGVLAAATLCACGLAFGASGLPFAATMAFIFLIAAWLPAFWGLDVQSAHQIAEAERARSRSEREAAVAAVQNASDRAELLLAEERVRLASELHDTVSARLAAISLQSQAAMAGLEDERRREIVGQIRSEAVEALGEMKKQITLLRGAGPHQGLLRGSEAGPGGALDTGLEPGRAPDLEPGAERLDDLAARSRSLGQNARLEGPPLDGLSPETSRLVYRVVHEGLLNAAKHAPGADVLVAWELRQDVVVVRLSNPLPAGTTGAQEDPPLGARPDQASSPLPGTRLGLASLRERLRAAHGSFAAGPVDGQWSLVAEIPRLPAGVSAVTRAAAPDPTPAAIADPSHPNPRSEP